MVALEVLVRLLGLPFLKVPSLILFEWMPATDFVVRGAMGFVVAKVDTRKVKKVKEFQHMLGPNYSSTKLCFVSFCSSTQDVHGKRNASFVRKVTNCN